MSRVSRRAGSKRSAKVNKKAPAGANQKKQLNSSWFGRPYGRSARQ